MVKSIFKICPLSELKRGDMFYLLDMKNRKAILIPCVKLNVIGIRTTCCTYPDLNVGGWLHSKTLVINLNKNIAYEKCIKQSCDKGAQVKDES